MFAQRFLPLISRHPEEAEALRRVAAFFEGIEERRGDRVFQVRLDPQHLFDIAQAGSASRLAKVTSILLAESILERRILVRTPQGQGIEFRSYEELPDIVRDPARDIDIEVTVENIEASYVVVPDGRH